MATSRAWLAVFLAAACAAPAPAIATERTARVLWWSGYRWTVRSDRQPSPPDNNIWGSSRAHARVLRDGRLRLNMVGLESTELIGPPTGYGRYRWVLDSDVSRISPYRVIALHVQGTTGEVDVEFSRWGAPLSQAGSWVTWQNGQRLAYELFDPTPWPPYVIVIDWRPGTSQFVVRDNSGKLLLSATTPAPKPGRFVSPRISYWHFHGIYSGLQSPFTSTTRHPPVTVRSFRFTRLAK